ncbi:MAG: peptide ABC transporter permease [Anaerolineae bacterium]|nr:MAG: peptide ABC transporter permease [Anaerolineae bacterium]
MSASDTPLDRRQDSTADTPLPTPSLVADRGQIQSPGQRALRRFLRHRLAVASLIFMILVTLTVFPLAPLVAPIPPEKTDLRAVRQPPSREHFLGTDLIGRDVLSRVVYGGRVSIAVGLVAVLLFLSIGTLLGSLAGYYGGRVDMVIMRVTDTFMAFPVLVILISIVAIVGPGLRNAMIAIGLIGWTGVARLVRGQILAVREMDFVLAAEAIGVPRRQILLRHILPSIVAPITVAGSFGIAGAILTEAGLSFLGLGVQVPTPSWGNMLNEAQSIQIIESFPWLWLPPGLMISLCVLAINFIGDGLRDALDPRMTLD